MPSLPLIPHLKSVAAQQHGERKALVSFADPVTIGNSVVVNQNLHERFSKLTFATEEAKELNEVLNGSLDVLQSYFL